MVVAYVFKDKLGIADALGLKSGGAGDTPEGDQPEDEQPEQTVNPIDQGKWNESAINDWSPKVVTDMSRVPSDFDWVQYLKNNPDLITAGIDTKVESEKHFSLNGVMENRTYTPDKSITSQQSTIKANITRSAKDPLSELLKSPNYKRFWIMMERLRMSTENLAKRNTSRQHRLAREEFGYDARARALMSEYGISQSDYAKVNEGFTKYGYTKLKKPL